MDKQKIEEIVRKKIKTEFKEFSDVAPHIEQRLLSISGGTAKKAGMKGPKKKRVWIAVFRKYFTTEDGTEIQKILRVTINGRGKILKITHSR